MSRPRAHPTSDTPLTEVEFSIARCRYGSGEDKRAPSIPPESGDCQRLEQRHPVEVLRELGFRPGERATPEGAILEPWIHCSVKPLLETALLDPHICRGPDGRYFLSGTVGADRAPAEDGTTLRLWQSTDLVQWRELAVVWDIGNPETCRYPDRVANAWTRWSRFDGAALDRRLTSPKLFYLRGTFWITFSLCHHGSGILKSLTGKPEGPYAHAGLAAKPPRPTNQAKRLTTQSGTPSLFEDVDGAIYAIWDAGWIARLEDDLAGLAEPPRLLQVTPDSSLGDHPLTCGVRGASIVRMQGKYILTASEVCPRLAGNRCHDTFCAISENLFGPYDQRTLLLPHGGPASLFDDETGHWLAVAAGHPEDACAACRERAYIVPIYWDRGFDRPMRRLWCITEDGPIARLKPARETTTGKPIEIRDPQALLAADGWTYVAGTHRKDAAGLAGIRLWRSRDHQSWDPVHAPDGDPFVWKVSESKWADQKTAMPLIDGPDARQWGAQPFEHGGTFYLPFMIWPLGQTGILRSTSGRPEGPYEETGFRCKDGAPHLFRDDDGTVWIYFCFGPTRVAPLNGDLSSFAGELADVTYEHDHQQGYEGSWILKDLGKYFLFQSDRYGEDRLQTHGIHGSDIRSHPFMRYNTYDWMVTVADHIRGPYRNPRPAIPHGGTGSIIPDGKGGHLATLFGADGTAPFVCSLATLPIKIGLDPGDIPSVQVL